MAGAKEAIIADFLKAFGQDVLQEAADELLGWQGAVFPAPATRLPIAEGDVSFGQLENTIVAKGHPEDVGREILQSGFTRAHRLTMHHPLRPPGLGWYLLKQVGCFQGRPELGSKQAGEGLDMHEKGVAGAQPALSVGGETATRNELMDVRMIHQVAGPRLQHPQQPDLPTHETRVSRQFLQRRRRGLEQ